MMEISTTNIYDDRPIQRREKRRILVNLVVLSVSFMIHYSAVNGILQLQSTINASESLGTAALTSNFAGFLFSSVFGSTTLLHWLGCKWTVVACYLAFVPYFFSQIYPELSSMVLTALLLGLASGPLACAQGTYLSVLSEVYSELTGLNSGVVTMQFFTVFYMLYNSSQIWGNLVSSFVFSLGDDQVQDNVECGATFCLGTASATNNTNLERPSDDKIYTVVGIYLGCIAVATCIVAFGLESLKR
uniref:UNC93-like protein n=1 Tax=Timema cristinae TaxID=61476 RepID=A0A7R9DFZ1_TIMCR|nr:unnamed protein product [Timema cristinae]